MVQHSEDLGIWLENESMARYVSWKTGGRARLFFRPHHLDALLRWFDRYHQECVYPIGLGSNLLVRDGGFNGVVVGMHHALSKVLWQPASESINGHGLIFAESGVPTPKVARLAIQHGLAEAEWLATIPGTVGGALAMNAGCYGYETWSYVRRVAVVVPGMGYQEFTPEDYAITYRSVKRDGLYVGHECPHYFLGAWFDFPKDSADDGGIRMKTLLTRRIQTQPLNFPNAGSVFRNPENDFAARLIEQSGLKGYICGGARVSEKHANFIVNPEGTATANDIEKLINIVQHTVAERTGVMLSPEVRIIGEHA